MDKTALVSIDLERGREVLKALRRANVRLSVAAWVHLAEYEDWRLLLASRQFDAVSVKEAYRMLNETLDAAGFRIEDIPSVLILPISDPFIRELRRIFSKTRAVDGVRLGGQMIDGRFVDDGYAFQVM